MTRSSISRVGGVALGVAGGAVVGALLFAPLTSLAQDDATESPDAATPSQQDDDDRPGMRGWGHGPGGHGLMMGGGLETAADALGVTEDDLRTALRDGQSLADVAAEQGVEVQDLVDALVAAATERIDEAVQDGRIDEERAAEIKADLPERIADMVERDGPPGRGGHGPGGFGGGMGPGPCHDDDESDDSAGTQGSTSGTSATTAGVDATGTVLMAV